jgi:cell division transport system permease protein
VSRFLLGEALRDLWRAGRVAASAVVLITLSLVALGGFWMLSANLGRAVAQWRDRVRIIVYLKRDPSDIQNVLGRVRGWPEVASVTFVGKAEALSSLKRLLGRDANLVDQLSANPLPSSLEVTPSAAGATPDGARGLIERLAAMPEAEEVSGGAEWIERLAQWQRLFEMVGLGIGSLLALAAILTVTTSTTLVLHARRQETEIMRLVGAPEMIIRLPLLLQGMIQGLLGASIAVLLLVGAHRTVAPWVAPLLDRLLGLPDVAFLAASSVAALIAAGAGLGGLGGLLAQRPLAGR